MVCTKQFCSYRDRTEDFAALNASVVGISSQDLASHEAFGGADPELAVVFPSPKDRPTAR